MTTTFEVSKEIRWEMAHRLVKGYTGKCNSLHGHSWVAQVVVGGQIITKGPSHAHERLDQYDMLFDFGDFKPLKQWLDDSWDHATMLYYKDPLLALLDSLPECRVFTVTANPTSEFIATQLMHYAVQLLRPPVGCKVTRIEVNETCTSKVLYYGG
jgi:6-pyruvoyl-tetrahydropterin synthase